jgi:hypothetical protein
MLSIELVPVGVQAEPVVGSVWTMCILPNAVVPDGLVLTVALPASTEEEALTVPPDADLILRV